MAGITNNPRMQAASFRINFKGVFHIKSYYESLHEWMIANDWFGLFEGDETGKHEHYYFERTNLDGTKEFWIWWRMVKKVENPYYVYQMFITFHGLGVTDCEVMHQGKKLKVNKGECEIKIRTWVELDQNKDWSNHWFLQTMHKIFPERIWRKEYENHKRELYRETYQLQGYMKRFLQLHQYLPEKELEDFHPGRTFPG